MLHVFKTKKLAKTYVTAVLAKCSKLYCSEGEKPSKKKMAYGIDSPKLELADTKLIKSFTRLTRIGFEKIHERRAQPRHTYDTKQLYNSDVKSNLKKVRKEDEDNMESEFRTQHTILNFKF